MALAKAVSAPAPVLRRSITLPPTFERGEDEAHADLDKRKEWLSERLSTGQQPLSEAMLLHITSGAVDKTPTPSGEPRQALALRAFGSIPASAAGAMDSSGAAAADVCPFAGFGRSPVRPPAPTGCNDAAEGECRICFERRPLARVCDACPVSNGACCVECLRTYFTTVVKDALYAMPMILCPLCRGRIRTADWAPYVSGPTHDKYLGNASALCSIRCPACDEATSLFSAPSAAPAGASGELQAARQRAAGLRAHLEREELWCDLLVARAAALKRRANCSGSEVIDAVESKTMLAASRLVGEWRNFECAEICADEFVTRIYCTWPPGRGAQLPRSLERAMRRRVPLCIDDPERRLALQLAWLRRYPKVRTTCCKERVCFKCKVRGWHRGVSCEERQRMEAGRDAQQCPNCGVPTTRSEGCDHIRCVCGAEWTWQTGGNDDGPDGTADDLSESSDGSEETEADEVLRKQNALELAASGPSSNEAFLRVLTVLVRNVVAAEGDSAKQKPVVCRRGHPLDPWRFSRHNNWTCDGCENGRTAGVKRFRCVRCDYDLCEPCYNSRTDTKELSPQAADSAQIGLEDSKDEPAPHELEIEASSASIQSSALQPSDRSPTVGDTGGNSDAFGASRSSLSRLPLHLAIRARNTRAVRLLLEHGAPLSEVALWELVHIPQADERRMVEDELRPHLKSLRLTALPLWARLHFGLLGEGPLRPDADVSALAFISLRRLEDPAERQRVELMFRTHLGDEWFDAFQAAAATEELQRELRDAATRKREPDTVLVDKLLALGADPQAREVARDRGQHEDDSEDGSDHGNGRQNQSESSSDEEEEDYGSTSEYWCPGLHAQLSSAELIAVHGRCGEETMERLLLSAKVSVGSGTDEQESPPSQVLTTGHAADEQPQRVSEVNVEQLPPSSPLGAVQPHAPTPASRRRGRLLTIALHSRNVVAVKELLRAWGSDPLPTSVWYALHSIVHDTTRRECEKEFHCLVAARGLDAAAAPLWALIQLGIAPSMNEGVEGDVTNYDPLVKAQVSMYTEACAQLQALLAEAPVPCKVMEVDHGSDSPPTAGAVEETTLATESECAHIAGDDDVSADTADAGRLASAKPEQQEQGNDGLPTTDGLEESLVSAVPPESEASPANGRRICPQLPSRVFIALRRCGSAVAREHFESLICASIGSKRFLKKRSKSAARELLAELRSALSERRSPDVGLAAQLLQLGADPCARECDEDGDEEDPWVDRDDHIDGSLRTSLELIALNRHAEAFTTTKAVDELIALRADPNHSASFGEQPLAIALRCCNVPAARALLAHGAEMTPQVLLSLRRVQQASVRKELEDLLRPQFQQKRAMTLQDVGLWAAVQCGFKDVVRQTLERGTNVHVDTHVFVALRRCRLAAPRQDIEAALRKHLGELHFGKLRAEAASAELSTELREAIRDGRDPDEALVEELLQLGANPCVHGVSLDEEGSDGMGIFDEEADDSDSVESWES